MLDIMHMEALELGKIVDNTDAIEPNLPKRIHDHERSTKNLKDK